MISIGCDLCLSYLLSGDCQRIIHIAPSIINLIESCQKQGKFFGFNRYPWILGMLGLSWGASGEIDQARRLFEKALTYALNTNHSGTVGIVEWGYGAMLAVKGDGKDAIEHLRNAVKYLEESQSVLMLGLAWAFWGFAHCLIGMSVTGIEMTEKGLKMHSDLETPWWISCCHWLCSYAQFSLGNLIGANEHAELSLQFSVDNNERSIQGLSRVWLGRVIGKTDSMQIVAAEQQINKGIALLKELGNRVYYSLGYLWLGEVNAEAGRHEAAQDNLINAEAMFREMGMDYWLTKAQEAKDRLQL